MATNTGNVIKSDKSAVTTLLLCIFLGGLGIHRFYVGKIGTGILMLVTAGGFGIWTLVDIITIACCNFTDNKGHYIEFARESTSTFMRVVWIIALVLVSFLVYILLICAVVFYATSGLTDTVRDQLTALRMHDYNKAYSYTSIQFQKATSEAQFEKFVSVYPALNNNKDSTFTDRSIENGTGTLKGSVQAVDGSQTPIIYELVKENGKWKIQNIEVNPGNSGVNTEKPKVQPASDDQQTTDDKQDNSDDQNNTENSSQ